MASKITLGLHSKCTSSKMKHFPGLPSILERRNTLILKCYSKVQAICQEHDICKLTFAKDGISYSLISIRSWKTFNELISSLKLNSPCFSHFLVSPSCQMSPPSVSLELIPFQKTTFQPIQIQALFQEKMTTLYPDSPQIYTDGSVKGSKCGTAFVTPSCSLNIKNRLPDNTSILTAELSAIKEALKVININPLASKRLNVE